MPHTKMIAELSLSRTNLKKRHRSSCIDHREGHMVGSMEEWAEVQKPEECVLCGQEIRHPRTGFSCGN